MPRFGKTPESERLVRSSGIDSYGTQNSYESALRGFIEFAREAAGYEGSMRAVPESLVRDYLDSRAEQVSQSTLDRDRQAISAVTGQQYERIKADSQKTSKSTEPRAYTNDQVQVVKEFQSQNHALSTQVAQEAGLRAHELYTIRPASEQTATQGRKWSEDRFTGREQGERYTVVGKGGLVREVALTRETAQRLENYRRETPQTVTDRKVEYRSHYAIPGGQSWSQSISDASNRVFGWSHGAHGIRHEYAQDRMKELREAGYNRDDALRIVSQEMGHFRPDITEVYLR